MSKGHVTYIPEGRLGNALFQAAAAMSYAWDHGMEFSMPTASRSATWAPVYCQHLARPDYDPALPVINIEERGYAFQQLPWDDRWSEGHNIVLRGFFQSERYFAHRRERVLQAFGFPWEEMAAPWVATHVRRGDALLYPEKHLIQSKEWIEEQMAKFPGHLFRFFSDDLKWCRENFGHRTDCHFLMPHWLHHRCSDHRTEVWDMVDGSCCEHHICSASTFSLWQAMLNRNPNKRVILPKLWLVPGWQGTTEETWADVVPVGPNWERA